MRWSATWRSAAVGGILAVLVASGVGPASAGSDLSATATTTTAAAQGTTTRLAGLAVSGASSGDTLAVTVATSRGTLTVDTSTGVSLAYGNTATGSSVSFTGSPTQVDAALAATDLTVPGGTAGLRHRDADRLPAAGRHRVRRGHRPLLRVRRFPRHHVGPARPRRRAGRSSARPATS